MSKHGKELSTNEKFDKIMERENYILMQKSFSFSAMQRGKKPFFMHVSVCKGFDRLYLHPERKPLLVEIKSNIRHCPDAIKKIRQILKDRPFLAKWFDIWIVGWKGGRTRYDRRTSKKVMVERGYFLVYKLDNEFQPSEKLFYKKEEGDSIGKDSYRRQSGVCTVSETTGI
jgi:hypothetical protein